MEEELIVSSASSSMPMWAYIAIGIGALIVFAFLFWSICKLTRLLSRPEMMGLTREEIGRRLVQIHQTAGQGLMGAKLAIMEADMLLDASLKSIMMPGDTLGERLKVACYKYPSLRDVWWAHKLRNQIAHEATFQISERQAKQAIIEFEKALRTLNVL
jgi:hypothetical protein